MVEHVFPPILREQYPFRIIGRLVTSVDSINLTREQKANNVSFAGSSKITETLQKVNYAQCIKSMLLLYSWNPLYRSAALMQAVHNINAYDNKKYWPIVSNGKGLTTRQAYVSNMKRLEPILAEYTSKIGGRSIRMDHTFKVAKFGRVSGTDGKYCSFYCLLSVMNEYGEIVGWWFSSSKSMAMLEKELELMTKRSGINVRDIWIDNPHQETSFLQKTFGNEVSVYRDIFHLTKDFYDECAAKSNLRQQFMGELSNAIFAVSESDILDNTEDFVSKYAGATDMRGKSMKWFKDNKKVRNFLKCPNKIIEGLVSIRRKYRDKKDLFKKGMLPLFEKTIHELKSGIYGKVNQPIDQHLKGKDGIVYSTRGSSILESFHMFLQGFLEGYSLGIVPLHFICCDMVYRWNMNRGLKLGRQNCLAIYEPQLLTDVVVLCNELGLCIPNDFCNWKALESQWKGGRPTPLQHEMFGSLQANYNEIWYQEAKKYYEKHPDKVRYKRELEPHEVGFDLEYQLYRLYTPILAMPITTKSEKSMFMYLLFCQIRCNLPWPLGVTSVYTMVSLSIENKYIRNRMMNLQQNDMQQIAQKWCALRLKALEDEEKYVKIVYNENERGTILFEASNIYLKSERNIKDHCKEVKKMIESLELAGSTHDERSTFIFKRQEIETVSEHPNYMQHIELDIWGNPIYELIPPVHIPYAKEDFNRDINVQGNFIMM